MTTAFATLSFRSISNSPKLRVFGVTKLPLEFGESVT
jgi:hypothetical protein